MNYWVLGAMCAVVFMLVVGFPLIADIRQGRALRRDCVVLLKVFKEGPDQMTLAHALERMDWQWGTARIYRAAQELTKTGKLVFTPVGGLRYYRLAGR